MCWHQNERRGRSRTGAQSRSQHARRFGAHKQLSLGHERYIGSLVHEPYIGTGMVMYGLRLTVGLVIQCVWADLYQVHGMEEAVPCAICLRGVSWLVRSLEPMPVEQVSLVHIVYSQFGA